MLALLQHERFERSAENDLKREVFINGPIVGIKEEFLMKETGSKKEFLTNESAGTRLINHIDVAGLPHGRGIKAIKTSFVKTYAAVINFSDSRA